MKSTIQYILAVIISCAGFASPASAADIKVAAQVDGSKDIYVGQRFNYYIVINGKSQPAIVDTTSLASFNPTYAGGQASMNTINRRTTKRFIMTYQLTAPNADTAIIPHVNVTIDGNTYTTSLIKLKIQQPRTTERMELQMEMSEDTCYVGQPVTLTVKWLIDQAIVNSVKKFSFNVPALTSNAFMIEDVDSGNPNAQPYNINGVNVYFQQNNIKHKGTDYVEVSFSKVLIPKQLGELQISPSSVSLPLPVGQRKRSSFFESGYDYKFFIAKSDPLSLQVQPMPDLAKPKGFYGLIGDYSITASATPTKVNVGDPITLTVRVTGKYLKPVRWPVLTSIQAITDNFKVPVEKAAPVIRLGSKVFTQTIRANNDAVTEIPPIPLAYFDTDKGKYIVTESDPIHLDVAPTNIVTTADAQGRDSTPINRKVKALKKGISANIEDFDLFADKDFLPLAALTSPIYLTIWLTPFAAFILSAIARFATHNSPARLASRRRRSAARDAIADLKKISNAEDDRKHQLLSAAMRQYLGRRFDRTSQSLTAIDCHRIIIDRTNDSQLASDYQQIVESCEAVSFSRSAAVFESTLTGDVIQLIKNIERGAK